MRKSTGIVRKIDELGRIVIPKETRNILSINEGDSVEIFTEDNMIFLKKYAPGCVFCGDLNNLSMFNGLCICGPCRTELGKL